MRKILIGYLGGLMLLAIVLSLLAHPIYSSLLVYLPISVAWGLFIRSVKE